MDTQRALENSPESQIHQGQARSLHFLKIFNKYPNKGTLPQTLHHLSTQFFINSGHAPRSDDPYSKISQKSTEDRILSLSGPRALQDQSPSNHNHKYSPSKIRKTQSQVQAVFVAR